MNKLKYIPAIPVQEHKRPLSEKTAGAEELAKRAALSRQRNKTKKRKKR